VGKKEKIFFGVGIFLLVLASFFLGRLGNPCNEIGPSPLPTPTLSFTTTSLTPEVEGVSTSSESGIFKVTRVIDGDTVEIEGGEHVRYIGIDTPETVDPRKPVQCFGIEASKKNEELVEGKVVRLEKDITEKDKYGRLLRYVWMDDLFVNLELVKQGFATSYSYPPDIKYQKEFQEAEKEAREAKRGLWGACPISPNPTAQMQEPTGSECDIKGNISTSGDKIYHLPGCGSYNKTQIDVNRGERWFCTENEAQEAGWRKALNCP